jgi:transposase InsO family protein
MRAEGLLHKPGRRKRRGKGLSANSCTLLASQHVDHVWSDDFIKIRLADASTVRMLSVVDEFSRFAFPPLIRGSITALDLSDHLATVFGMYGVAQLMRSGNGPEFVAEHITGWLEQLNVGCVFVKPGSPWENAYVETFHDKLRDELLNQEVLLTPQEARIVIGDWIDHYNHDRRHSGLGYRTPVDVRYPVSPQLEVTEA